MLTCGARAHRRPVIRRNLFDVPEHDDRINPTRCSAIIVENVIRGSDDHGIVLRDKCSPVVMNNVIYNCPQRRHRNRKFVHGTIGEQHDCQLPEGDCGCSTSAGPIPPYFLAKGGGAATIINCIVWDCQTTISVSDSQQLDGERNAGSHITVKHCDIEGGRASVSISQQGSVLDSTVTWLEGNIDADPQFVDPNYHLKSQAGRWDPKRKPG